MEGLEVGPEVGPGVVSLLRATRVLFPSFFVPQGSVCFLLCFFRFGAFLSAIPRALNCFPFYV